MCRIVPCVPLLLVAMSATPTAQVLRAAELNTDQIRALDRARTAVVIPNGVLEEHGPYLPSFSDGYVAARLARVVAEAIAGRPGWTALVLPMVPLGAEGANEVLGKPMFPGTLTVSPATVRSVFMDLADALGEQGFQWVFVVNAHDGSAHQRVLHEAGDYFADTYRGQFVNLMDVSAPEVTAAVNTSGAPGVVPPREGGGPHGGWVETSLLLWLEPGLVQPAYHNARPVIALPPPGSGTGADLEALAKAGSSPDWPGYFGSPHLASAALGAAALGRREQYARLLTLKILDGLDPKTLKRVEQTSFGELVRSSPGFQKFTREFQERDEARRERQLKWLASRGR